MKIDLAILRPPLRWAIMRSLVPSLLKRVLTSWRPHILGRKVLILALALGLVVGACSPEATRTRGDGPGGDTANRVLGPSVDLHGTTNPLFDTPTIGKAVPESR